MSDEDFNDSPDLELEDDLVEDDDPLDDDLVVEADVEADDVDLLDDDLELSPEVPVAVVTDDTATETEDEEDEGVVDLEEELHPDDVEEPLDVLLQERTAVAALDDDEEDLEEEDADADDRVDGPTRIVPRRPDEFLCQSCFLLLPLRRLADKERQFCDDCA
ncbi:MAG TPA: DUF4193 family protein [Acidimicrobiia bacterium]